jgi:ankyrin repeat protein
VASRTQTLDSVKGFRWREVEASLAADPKLTAYRDERGRNFLHICCGVDVSEKRIPAAASVRTADVLLSAGIDVNQEAFREGDWKATPLWYAISRGRNLPLAEHLLRRGSDPNHCLWAAAFRDDLAAIALLLEHGAEIDPVAEDETPFLGAVKTSHFRAAEALLERGANVNFQDSQGMTALHYMLKKDSDKRHFRTLLRHGARGDLKNDKGETAAEVMSRKRDPDFKAMATQSCEGQVERAAPHQAGKRRPSTRRSMPPGGSGRTTWSGGS